MIEREKGKINNKSLNRKYVFWPHSKCPNHQPYIHFMYVNNVTMLCLAKSGLDMVNIEQ